MTKKSDQERLSAKKMRQFAHELLTIGAGAVEGTLDALSALSDGPAPDRLFRIIAACRDSLEAAHLAYTLADRLEREETMYGPHACSGCGAELPSRGPTPGMHSYGCPTLMQDPKEKP